MNDLISIVIPVYNAEKTICRCAESLLQQTYTNIECIFIDDGSTDHSSEMISHYLTDPRAKYMYQHNKGVSSARNEGIKAAAGKYIMFVDSDDCIESNACEKLISAYSQAAVELVVCGLNIYRGGILLRTPHLDRGVVSLNQYQTYWNLRRINLGPCNKLYLKEKITSLFDESLSLGEDTKFVLDYLRNCDNVHIISDCLYNVYLDNDASLNRKYRDDRLDMLISVRQYECQWLKERYRTDDIHQIYEEFFLDLHVILCAIIRNKKDCRELFQRNIAKFDYSSIKNYTKFGRAYYRLFSGLVVHNNVFCLIILLKIRVLAEKMIFRNG